MNSWDSLERLLAGWRASDPVGETWARITEIVDQCQAELRSLDLENRTLAISDWRERFHPWFLQAPNIARSFRKPLGYPGDFGVMDMGYRAEAEAETDIGNLLHGWFGVSFRASTAVRSRRRAILLDMQRHAIRTTGPWRAMSIASGSAWELRDLLRESFLSSRAEIWCLDQDPRALDAARRGLEETANRCGRTLEVHFVQKRIAALIAGADEEAPTLDYIYSLGLYDYLSPAAARALTAALYRQISVGGRIVVGNYARGFDAQAAIELVMDWHLRARTEQEMLALTGELPADAIVTAELDSTGSLWMLSVERPL